ncbi:MAG: hypothetical protein AB4426_31320, partial [Xenococcaceae cyanobacterium]
MRQSNFKKDLLFLAKGLLFSALVSGVLVSCIPGKITDGATNSPPARQEQVVEDSERLTNSLNQVKTAFNNLKASLDKFNTELKKVADGERHINVEKDRNLVDFDNPNQKLDELLQVWNKFKYELQKYDPQLQESVRKLTEQADANLKYLQGIIEPLSKGLDPKAVEQVQKHLDFFDREEIPDKLYGNFGPITQREIELVSRKKLQDSEKQIKDILIWMENQRLATENKKNYDELIRATKSQKKQDIFWIFFIFGEAAIILWLWHRNKELRYSLPRQTTIKDNDSQHELEDETGYPDERREGSGDKRREGSGQEDPSSNWNDARTHQGPLAEKHQQEHREFLSMLEQEQKQQREERDKLQAKIDQLTEQLQEAIQALREERKYFLSLLKSGINQPKRSQSSSNWNNASTHQGHYYSSWDTRRNPENHPSYKPNRQQNAPVTKPNLGISPGRSPKTARHHESSLPDDDLVAIYNNKPNLLAGKTIKVLATKESIEKRRLGYD